MEAYSLKLIADEIVDKKKLYGLNGGKKCRFVKIKFINEQAMKKYRGLYYYYEKTNIIKLVQSEAKRRPQGLMEHVRVP